MYSRCVTLCVFLQMSPERLGEHRSLRAGRPALHADRTWAVSSSAPLPPLYGLSVLPHHRLRRPAASAQQGSGLAAGHAGHLLNGLQGAERGAPPLEKVPVHQQNSHIPSWDLNMFLSPSLLLRLFNDRCVCSLHFLWLDWNLVFEYIFTKLFCEFLSNKRIQTRNHRVKSSLQVS